MRYRIWQFWQSLFAKPLTEEAWAGVRAQLTPAEVELFSRFSYSDQWHSVRVMQTLQNRGYKDTALLKAALLHDVGKTRVTLTVLERVLVVLGGKFLPKKCVNWGEGDAVGWQRPFVVKAKHPDWGADMAAGAGSDPLTISLIRRHQEPVNATAVGAELDLLQALQWADDQN